MEEREVNAIVPHGHEYRQSTDAAGLCGAIVKQTASNIQGRKYVSVEGWQAIAIAHGCAAGSRDVEKIEGGVRAIGEVRRMDDGQLIATAEGFVGEDEPTWFGGSNGRGRTLPKRPDYAIRAMAQTRAISRACRSAFAHVVVMIDAGLSTTPAEEVPEGGFVEGQVLEGAVSPREPATQADDKPKRVKLEGPYTSKTALWQAFKAFDRELRGCGDSDEFEILLDTPEAKALIEQCERDAPQLMDGGEDMPAEFLPLNALIEQRRVDFKQLATAEQMAGYART
jgi:hypothetical protein